MSINHELIRITPKRFDQFIETKYQGLVCPLCGKPIVYQKDECATNIHFRRFNNLSEFIYPKYHTDNQGNTTFFIVCDNYECKFEETINTDDVLKWIQQTSNS